MGVPMRRRHPLSSLPVWLVAFTARQAGAKPGSRLNILMLASDDMRPEIASPYGVPFMRTQNISRLAQQGTTFRYAYCQVAVCAPSRTALLTGTRNDWTRVWTIGPYFRRSMGAHADPKIFKTLPQMFKEHGYNVTGAGKIFHGGGPSGGQGCCGGYDMPYSWTEPYWDCDQFWNQTVQSPRSAFWPLGAGNTALDSPPFYTFVKSGTGCAQSDSCVACLVAHSRGWGTDVSWASAPCDDTCFPDGLVAQRTLEALRYKAAHRDQPFFLAAGFKRPHLGFYAPQWAYDLYPNESIVLAKHRTPPRDMPQPAFCPYGSMRVFEDTNKGGIFQPSPPLSSPAANGTFTVPLLPDWKHYELRRGYQAAVSFVDAQVGKLLDALEQLELRSTTAVVMWGDHGFQLGEHGEWGKFTNWELGTRIPLIVSLPPHLHPHPGTVSEALVEELDVFPTCLDIAGLPSPPQLLHGASLLPLLRDPNRVAFKANASFSQYPRHVGSKQYMGLTMRTQTWRFTEWCAFNYTKAYPIWDSSDAFACELELYTHAGDVGNDMDSFENVNVAYKPQNQALVSALHKQLLASWDNGLGPPPALPPSPSPSPSPHHPSGPPGPLVRFHHGSQCMVAVDDESSACSNPQCNGLVMGPCTANGSIFQEIHDIHEPTQIKCVGGPSGCLNLYGGGQRNCPAGTGVHRTSCGARYGNRFEWVPETNQIAFGEATEADNCGLGRACSGLCVVALPSGCVVVESCTDVVTRGWSRHVLDGAPPNAILEPAASAAAITKRVAVVVQSDCPVCDALLQALRAAAFNATEVTFAELAEVTRASYDVLVLPHAPSLPAAAAPAYWQFAKAGGHLVLLGGRPPRLNISAEYASLNVLSPYEPYQIRGAVSVQPLIPAATTVLGSAPQPIAGNVSGLSAVGWVKSGQSEFVPLLSAVDKFNRSTGWAFSGVVNTAGPYKGGIWLLSGIAEEAFVSSPVFCKIVAQTLGAAATLPNKISQAAAEFIRAGLAAQQQKVLSMVPKQQPPQGFVQVGTGSRPHLQYTLGGHRFFLLGGDYFRGMFSDGLTKADIVVDLNNAILSGMTTIRFYGFPASLLRTAPDTLALLRQMHAEHGLRVLFTLPCYKDPLQRNKSGVIFRTIQDASILANETWVLGYDLCNEIDDQYNFPGSLIVNTSSNVTLNDLYPKALHGWGDFEQAQCGGWSTTFDPAHCGPIDAPIREILERHRPDLLAGFDAMNSIVAEWFTWRIEAIRTVDTNHLITAGHNAEHALLPANDLLDFVSHHAYPSDIDKNRSCTAASFYNVTAIPKTMDILRSVHSANPKPITFGEFASKTPAGLWPLYDPPLPVVPPPAKPPLPPPPPSGPGCRLPPDCIAGVASTLGWYLSKHGAQKPLSCGAAWTNAVKDNAGPASPHHRCPAYAGTTFDGNLFYEHCVSQITAKAAALGGPHCDPGAATVWLHAIANGFDGALRWAISEKPWVIAAQSNTWVGDYTANDAAGDKAFDSYVASKFGSVYYDGSATGRLKPLALSTRFLSRYLRTSAHWTDASQYTIDYIHETAGPTKIGAAYRFRGPDCLFVGGSHGVFQWLTWRVNGIGAHAANVMLFSSAGRNSTSSVLRGQASADTLLTLSPPSADDRPGRRRSAPLEAAIAELLWRGEWVVEGHVGPVTAARDGTAAITMQALQGEEFTIRRMQLS